MTRLRDARDEPHVLREYALLADGERGALSDPEGNIAWLCAPRWHDDAVCSSMIGGRGSYAVTPVERHVWGGYYEPGSLIWRNRWVTSDSLIECREALAFPGDPRRLVLMRRIEALRGDAVVDVTLDLRARFGRAAMRGHARHAGVWTARTGPLHVRWSGAGRASEVGGGALHIRLRIPAGASRDLVLEVSDGALPEELPDADTLWSATEHSWHDAVPTYDDSVAPRDARHAYAVMLGLCSPTGGMVAAATLGLPERDEAARNYDYRYVWLRDQAYAGIAVSVHKPHDLLDRAVRVSVERLLEHRAGIAPAYSVTGHDLPAQTGLSLPGYPGGHPVVGNWVNGQFQLDMLGELLTLFASALRHDHLDGEGYAALLLAVDTVAEKWQAPDAGIWEIDNDYWTHSRLTCVAGLHAVARHLPARAAAKATSLADTILAETTRRCLHPTGYWRRRPGDDRTDAALLLPPVRGALPADDPRVAATLRRVGAELTEDGHVYRFEHSHRPLGDAEGAFTLCGFIMSLATWHQGDFVSAFRWFERNRAACGPPGLFAEEYDVRQRQLRGNLPQAFVHAALLETALRLAEPPQPTGNS
jgi:hypothetical protein